MKKNLIHTTVFTIAMLAFFQGQPICAETAGLEMQAVKVVDSLNDGDFAAVTDMFNNKMKSALPEDKLSAIWHSLLEKFGPFMEKGTSRSQKMQGYDLVFVPCKFEKAVLDCQVAFDDQAQIAGLYFKPAKTE